MRPGRVDTPITDEQAPRPRLAEQRTQACPSSDSSRVTSLELGWLLGFRGRISEGAKRLPESAEEVPLPYPLRSTPTSAHRPWHPDRVIPRWALER
jgi:hypothetical protein